MPAAVAPVAAEYVPAPQSAQAFEIVVVVVVCVYYKYKYCKWWTLGAPGRATGI